MNIFQEKNSNDDDDFEWQRKICNTARIKEKIENHYALIHVWVFLPSTQARCGSLFSSVEKKFSFFLFGFQVTE
jgi:hypothetical protein